jgi:GLPGLI family protein
MRKFFFLLLAALPIVSVAQNTEGVITYKHTTFMRKMAESSGAQLDPNMLRNIPESNSVNSQMTFTATKSMVKALASDTDEAGPGGPGGGDGPRMFFRGGNFIRPTYRDLSSNRQMEEQDLFGKPFLVDDKIRTYAWKITGKQKMVLNYPCIEAVTTDSMMGRAVTYTAYFSPAIPVGFGPNAWGGLPGVILELAMDGGRMVVEATEVKLTDVDDASIKELEKGKKVTREEFNKIRREKIKEMQESGMMGPGGPGGPGIRVIRG